MDKTLSLGLLQENTEKNITKQKSKISLEYIWFFFHSHWLSLH